MMREDSVLTRADRRRRSGGPDHPHHDNWVDSVVHVAQTCNQILARNSCRLCDVYADRQVEYETMQERQWSAAAAAVTNPFSKYGGAIGTSPVERVWRKTAPILQQSSLEVELYRQFLFDEESVVHSATGRDDSVGDIDDHHGEQNDYHQNQANTVHQGRASASSSRSRHHHHADSPLHHLDDMSFSTQRTS